MKAQLTRQGLDLLRGLPVQELSPPHQRLAVLRRRRQQVLHLVHLPRQRRLHPLEGGQQAVTVTGGRRRGRRQARLWAAGPGLPGSRRRRRRQLHRLHLPLHTRLHHRHRVLQLLLDVVLDLGQPVVEPLDALLGGRAGVARLAGPLDHRAEDGGDALHALLQAALVSLAAVRLVPAAARHRRVLALQLGLDGHQTRLEATQRVLDRVAHRAHRGLHRGGDLLVCGTGAIGHSLAQGGSGGNGGTEGRRGRE